MADTQPAAPHDRARMIRFMIVAYLLVMGYLFLNPKKETTETPGTAASNTTTGTLASQAAPQGSTPAAGDTTGSVAVDPGAPLTHPGELLSLRTEKYQVDVDKVGGVIHSWRLTDPGSQSYTPDPQSSGIEMVRTLPALDPAMPTQQAWPLEISFKEQNRLSYEDFNHLPWEAEPLPASGGAAMRLRSPSVRGVRVEKTLDLPRDKYFGTLRVTIHNETSNTLPVVDELNRGLTLRWGPGLQNRTVDELNSGDMAYDVAVARGPEEVETYRPEADGEPLMYEDKIQWAGVESKFFAALLVTKQPIEEPGKHLNYHFRTLVPRSYVLDPARATTAASREYLERYKAPLVVELSTDRFELAPNESRTFEFGVYVGPKKHSVLKQYGYNLQSLMFSESFSFMRAIYLLLTDLLNWIHRTLVSNYGIAIMVLTVIVKLMVFPLVHRSIKIQAKSSAEMKRVKPHLEAINEKYKDDPQEKSRHTWKVYQEHGINPLGAMRSCLPVLPQIPIFIGLYRVANDTIDLQGAHFLWIKDLSQADHIVNLGAHIPLIGSYFNILPVLVAGTQMLSSKIALKRTIQNITDDTQKQMQQMMVYLIPVMVMVTMYHFPAGLMLYWIASNVWQIGQTLITNRILDREEEKHLKAGPPPRKVKKPANPNSFMGKLMAQAENAKKEMERKQQEQARQQQKGGSSKKK